MKTKLWFLLLFALFTLVACAGEDGADVGDAIPLISLTDGDEETVVADEEVVVETDDKVDLTEDTTSSDVGSTESDSDNSMLADSSVSADNSTSTGSSISDSNTMSADNSMVGNNSMAAGGTMDAGRESEPETPERDPSEYTSSAAEAQAVDLLGKHPPIADFLSNYGAWVGYGWEDDDGVWWLDMYTADDEEWLGWGGVNLETGEIVDFFVPRELSPEEFEVGKTQVENLVLNDPEVIALVGDLDGWEFSAEYDRWEGSWYMWFERGIDTWVVSVDSYEDEWWINEIYDPNQLEADELAEWNRDQAIELAWESEVLWDALDGVDDWITYVTPQDTTTYAVSFIGDHRELFYALVDIESWEILEVQSNP